MKLLITIIGIWLMGAMGASFADFTLGFIPDTQTMAEDWYNDAPQDNDGTGKILSMTKFFVDNKKELDVVFVASLGDMTESHKSDSEWNRVKPAYDIFPSAGIPYAPCQGNHDHSAGINKWFPVSEFDQTAQWGGNFRGIENAFYLFEANGMKFLLLILADWTPEWGESPDVRADIDWANGIFAEYADRRAILVAHNISPGNDKETQVARLHDNIFMTVSGHRTVPEENWTTTSPGGQIQHHFTSDYQAESDGGTTVRYFTFKPDEDEVCGFTYNTTTQSYRTNDTAQFCFSYDMQGSGSVGSGSE